MKHIVIHLHRWVIWWFLLGILGAAIALPNIFFRNLTHFQERVLLFFGVVHWLLGGAICWAWEGVKLQKLRPEEDTKEHFTTDASEPEPNVLAELRAHHNKSVSPRHSKPRQDAFTAYLHHHEQH